MNIKETKDTLFQTLQLNKRHIIAPTENASSAQIRFWIDSATKVTLSECEEFNNLKAYFCRCDHTTTGLQPDFSTLFAKPDFWEYIYKQEAVLSAYETVRKMLAEKNLLNITDFSKITLPHGEYVADDTNNENFGLCYLLGIGKKEGHIPIAEFDDFLELHLDLPNNLCLTKEEGLDYHKRTNLKAPLQKILYDRAMDLVYKEYDFIDEDTAFQEIDEMLRNPDIKDLRKLLLEYYVTLDSNNTGHKITRLHNTISSVCNPDMLSFDKTCVAGKAVLGQLNTLEFFQYASKSRGNSGITNLIRPQLTNCDKYNQNKYNTLVNDYQNLVAELHLPGLYKESYEADKAYNRCKLELADKVYLRYQLEKMLSVELIDVVTKYVYDSEYYDFFKEQTGLISQCCLLPNVFGRQALMQVMLDNLGYQHLNLEDFGDSPLNSIGMRVSKTELNHFDYSSYENILHWKQDFTNTINVLRNFIFPIQNSYFFVTLWDSLSTDYPDKDDRLKTMFLLLSTYLNSEKDVKELLSFEQYIDKTSSSYTHLDKYNKEHVTIPFQCNTIRKPNGTVDSIPRVKKNNLLKKTHSLEYFSLYMRISKDIASTSKNRYIHNALIDTAYIDKLYKPSRTSFLKKLYRASKQL